MQRAVETFPKNTAKLLGIDTNTDSKTKRRAIADKIVKNDPANQTKIEQYSALYPCFNWEDDTAIEINLSYWDEFARLEKQLDLQFNEFYEKESEPRWFPKIVSVLDAINFLRKWKRFLELGGELGLGKGGVDSSDLPFLVRYQQLLQIESQRIGGELLKQQLQNCKLQESEIDSGVQTEMQRFLQDGFKEPLNEKGITASMQKDLPRNNYIINGEVLSATDDGEGKITTCIEHLTKVMHPRMIAAVSQVAHQGMLLEMERLLQSGRGPIPELPIPVHGSERSTYSITALPSGDVEIVGFCTRNVERLMDVLSSQTRSVSPPAR